MGEQHKPSASDLVPGYKHIVMRKDYLGGQPALFERRISVSQILEALAGGMTPDELWQDYKVPADVLPEILKFAAESVEMRPCG